MAAPSSNYAMAVAHMVGTFIGSAQQAGGAVVRAVGGVGGGEGGRISSILGVSVNGDVIRMAIADAPAAEVGVSATGRGGPRPRHTEELDISAFLERVPAHGTPEEQTAAVLRELILDGQGEGVPIRSIVAAYHDEDQAKRLSIAMDALGLTNYSLVSAQAAALAALVVGRQIGFARTVAVCDIDTWLYSCGIISVSGEQLGGIQTVTTQSLAAAGADLLDGVSAVIDAAARSARQEPDLVVLVGECAGEVTDPEFLERSLGRPLIVPDGPALVVARGASLLPSRPMRGAATVGAVAASDADWAPLATRQRALPDWFPNAAALGGILALVVVGALATFGLIAMGVFGDLGGSGGDADTTGPTTSESSEPPAPPIAEQPSDAPALTTVEQPEPEPEPEPVVAPAPEPAPAPPAPPAPPPAPAPAPPPVISIPGLPPITIPQLP